MTKPSTNYAYSVELIRQDDGAGFGRRRVPASYLEPAREQVIFSGQRRGLLDADPTGLSVADEPLFADEAAGEVSGVRMSTGDGADSVTREFGLGIFQSFTQKVATELVSGKQLSTTDEVRWRVFAEEEEPASTTDARVTRQPLPLLEGRLDDFLSRATAVGTPNDDDYPVFALESALQQAHEFVWERNRERGVWLLGNLVRQTGETHEVFCVIQSVFEAQGTTHERFSLNFSTETFTHAQKKLELFNRRFGRPLDLLVGFYHTHPFLPSILDGMEACPHCSLRPTCKLTSSFFSQRDQAFHAAMFGSAPYAVEFVLGLTPREEFDLKMFCCDGGRFRERGYYRLAEMPAAALQSTRE